MAIYTVFLPPEGGIEAARFLPDRAPWLALVLPPVFLAWHRLWLALALYCMALLALLLLARLAGSPLLALLALLPPGLVYFAGSDLVRASLIRRGWQEAQTLCAESHDIAELRYYCGIETGGPGIKVPVQQARPDQPELPFAPGVQSQGAAL